MPTYVVLAKFTQQGIQDVKEIPKRREAGRKAAADLGMTLREGLLTMGKYDLVLLLDAPDDATMAQYVIRLGMQGNLSTQTLRAFSEAEVDQILGSI